ncbi:MAG: M23 family metallopeptidase [Gemmatimonadetes bacterium]|nr:M23 family metallopeptidase [Gemmatimonadota bacterium]
MPRDDDRQMTFIWIPHGRDPGSTRSYELSYRRVRAMLTGAGVLAFVLLLMAGSWFWLAAQAARVPGLTAEVRELRRDRVRVRELGETVERLSAEYAKVRSMLGADSASLPAIDPAAPAASAEAADPPADAQPESAAARPRSSLPRGWPLAAPGFVTRGHLARIRGSHPGMDIAVASGSQILASGGGTVAEVGEDSVYGRFVRIAHPEGYESLYAHASSLLVQAREPVHQGRVIALSGSTGVSTAPHLHFEIRKDGRPVDPSALIHNPN